MRRRSRLGTECNNYFHSSDQEKNNNIKVSLLSLKLLLLKFTDILEDVTDHEPHSKGQSPILTRNK